MNKPISVQQLAVVPVRRVRAPAGAPAQPGNQAPQTPKSGADRVTITSTSQTQQTSSSVSVSIAVAAGSPSAFEAQMQAAMDGLRGAFYSKDGDDRYDARFDFNADGVINAGDLGMLREKLAMNGPVRDPQPPAAEPQPAPPTLQELRDAFYTRSGDDNFNAAADLNSDGVVNAQDLALYRDSMSTPVTPPQVQAVQPDIGAAAQPTQPVPPTIVADPAAPANVKGGDADATEPVVDAAATTQTASHRDNILAQLRAAFFSTRGDDRFDGALDVNGDGRINVGDFVAARFAALGLNQSED